MTAPARRRDGAHCRIDRHLRSDRSAKTDAALALYQPGDQPRRPHGRDRSRQRQALRFSCDRSVGSDSGTARHCRLDQPCGPDRNILEVTGNPYVHDTFPRDGLLFLALWNDGVEIWDIGGCGTGATPEAPEVLGSVKTLGGEVHNIWWYHDPNGSKRFAFVGEEGPGTVGSILAWRHSRDRPHRPRDSERGRVLHGVGRRDPQFFRR